MAEVDARSVREAKAILTWSLRRASYSGRLQNRLSHTEGILLGARPIKFSYLVQCQEKPRASQNLKTVCKA
jgi:hypothetical protein